MWHFCLKGYRITTVILNQGFYGSKQTLLREIVHYCGMTLEYKTNIKLRKGLLQLRVQISNHFPFCYHIEEFGQLYVYSRQPHTGLDCLINRMAMGQAWFLLCTGFISFLMGDFESCYLWFLFPKTCWNIYLQKMLQILFSSVCIKYFLLVLSKRWTSMENQIQVLLPPQNALTLQLSPSLLDTFTYFARSNGH